MGFYDEKCKFGIKLEGVSRYGMNSATIRTILCVSAKRVAAGALCVPRYVLFVRAFRDMEFMLATVWCQDSQW